MTRDELPRDESTPDEGRVEQLLERALHREADAIRPSPDGLHRIRAQIARQAPALGRRPRSRRRPARPLPRWTPIAAAAAAVLMVAGGTAILRPGVWGLGPTAAQPGRAIQTRSTQPAIEPLPVYFVERQGGRWALVREFEPTTLTDPTQRLQTAVRLAVTGRALDPDYTSIWRERKLTGEVRTVRAGSTLTVVLAGSLLGQDGTTHDQPADAALATLAVQQLTWTATAAAQASVPVEVRSDAANPVLLGNVQLNTTFARGFGTRDPRAPVWISSLTENQSLTVGKAMITGDATAILDGDVTWTLRRTGADPGADPIREGTIDQLLGDDRLPVPTGQRGSWQVELDLRDPGTYVLEVRHSWSSSSGGEVQRWVDTKTFRVG